VFKHLTIKNYALIENLEIDFHKGLNIITGETGSGKSIMLGALGLILGERADKSAVFKGKSKCIVEGVFQITEESRGDFFEKNDLDFEEETRLRREVLTTGKSRAFINDTPVTLNVLKELGMRLVDIHSQHQTTRLNKPNYQLKLFDQFAGSHDFLSEYRVAYRKYTALESKVQELEDRKRTQLKEADFIKFQLQELEEANLGGLNSEEIDEEYNTLSNAEEITRSLYIVSDLLSEGETPAISSLKEAAVKLSGLENIGKAYSELSERLRSAIIEIEDLYSEVSQRIEGVEMDPKRLEHLENLKTVIFRLEQKHGVEGVASLLEIQSRLRERLGGIEHLDLDIESYRQQLKSQKEILQKAGLQLRKLRTAKVDAFAKQVEEVLESLNMKKAVFNVELTPLEEPGPNGMDTLKILFSANKGVDPQPIGRVASGGELSRLMLALKYLSSNKQESQSLVFDEIDTGVSGEVANSMGVIMKSMSQNVQLLAITHLPQIAAKGDTHYKVFKTEEEEGTTTSISQLNEDERIIEIAHMLSGKTMTEAAIANARDLLHLN
jgi:DNA repair protein RecN (Recombination protein N)